MKLKTIEEERAEANRWHNKDAFIVRSARDIDTLLAEVERLKLDITNFLTRDARFAAEARSAISGDTHV